MTPEERIAKLEEMHEKTQVMLAKIVESLGRLERISGANTLSIDDLDKRLAEIEARPPKKPN